MNKSTFPYELVGLEIEVIKAANQNNVGIKGKVVDETRFLLKVEQSGKIKRLLKQNITFKIKPSGRIIEGKTITKRPEERLK
ncbi:MAG TPA: ribonuclease P protein subunit [Candidatus Nanoarchaeia archaeon]|nr:ribonuclease P protein subunit [Candidatus Nanoarchaeia archaeon]